MINNWKKFNESWFSKKSEESTPSTPKVLTTSTPPSRNTSSGLSDEEIEKLKSKSISSGNKVDVYFMQEISDRLYGPDAEEYIKALEELNSRFRAREGRSGSQLYDPSIKDERRRKEGEINKNIEADTQSGMKRDYNDFNNLLRSNQYPTYGSKIG
jgi:uncharacterized protein YdaL